MKERSKHTLSIVLVLSMLLSLLPVGAFADSEEDSEPEEQAAANPYVISAEDIADTSWYYSDETQDSYKLATANELAGLAKLVNAGKTFAGVTITLANDIDLYDVEVSVSFDVDVENATIKLIDADEKEVTPEEDGSYKLTYGKSYSYTVTSGELTASDSFNAVPGAITVKLDEAAASDENPAAASSLEVSSASVMSVAALDAENVEDELSAAPADADEPENEAEDSSLELAEQSEYVSDDAENSDIQLCAEPDEPEAVAEEPTALAEEDDDDTDATEPENVAEEGNISDVEEAPYNDIEDGAEEPAYVAEDDGENGETDELAYLDENDEDEDRDAEPTAEAKEDAEESEVYYDSEPAAASVSLLSASAVMAVNEDPEQEPEEDETSYDSYIVEWVPIGTSATYYFAGTFNGAGHTISNLYIDADTSYLYAGLFGYVSVATIEDLTLGGELNLTASATKAAFGSIAGYAVGGTVQNCVSTVDMTVSSSYQYIYAGGIVGYQYYKSGAYGDINNCTFAGSLDVSLTYTSAISYIYTAGITGYMYYGQISYCVNTASVSTYLTASTSVKPQIYAGGAAGWVSSVDVLNTSNSGRVSAYGTNVSNGLLYCGGVLGYTSNGNVEYCANTGSVDVSDYGTQYTGGIAGYVNSSSTAYVVRNCYNQGDVSASNTAYCGGIVGAVVKGINNKVVYALNYTTSGSVYGGAYSLSTALTYVEPSYYYNYYRADETDLSQTGLIPMSDTDMRSLSFVEKLGYAFVQEDGQYPTLYTGTIEGDGQYLVTFDYNEASITTDAFARSSTQIYVRTDGEDVLSAPRSYSLPHYEIEGWYVNGEGEAVDLESYIITGNVTLVAKWQAETYTVTFDYNYKENEADEDTKQEQTSGVEYRATVAEPDEEPSRTGYTFLGWYLVTDAETSSVETLPYDFTTPVTQDITLLAVWQIDSADYKWYTSVKEANGDAYVISTGLELVGFERIVNGTAKIDGENTVQDSFSGKTVKLGADIDLTDVDGEGSAIVQWTPVGSTAAPFSGTFDGQEHTISEMNVVSTASYQGFFGYVSGAAIKNLTLIGSVTGAQYVGGVAAYAANGSSFENVTFGSEAEPGSVTGTLSVGGLVGYMDVTVETDAFIGCVNYADVTATTSSTTLGSAGTGGIVGIVRKTATPYIKIDIKDCVNYGNITSAAAYTAGIAGYQGLYIKANAQNCVNYGDITASNTYTSGLFGYVASGETTDYAVIDSCGNEGNVTVTSTSSYTGGVLAYGFNYVQINECWNSGDITGTSYIAGVVGDLGTYAKLYGCYNTGSVTSNATGMSYVAGVLGYVGGYAQQLESCWNSGDITSNAASGMVYIAGIVPLMSQATSGLPVLTGCYNTGNITVQSTGSCYVGGVVGQATTWVTECYNTGNISAVAGYIGGVAGRLANSATALYTIKDCYSTGNVSGTATTVTYVGGITSYVANAASGALNCYNTGSVTGGNSNVGSISAFNYAANSNCYYLESAVSGTIDAEYATAKSAEYFASGAVARLLDLEDDDENNGEQLVRNVWTQSAEDASPVLGEGHVYEVTLSVTYLDEDETSSVTISGEIGSYEGVYYAVADSELTLTAEPGDLSALAGLTVNNESVLADAENNIYIASVSNDLTIEASFGVAGTPGEKYTVTFKSNGGSEVDSQTVEWGNTATEPDEPELDGYIFVGWYSDAALTKQFSFSTKISGDRTLYAKWYDAGQIQIAYDANLPTGAELTGASANIDFTLSYNERQGEAFKWPLSLLSSVISGADNITITFTGWNTEADGSGTSFSTSLAASSDKVPTLTYEQNKANSLTDAVTTITLYAQWNVEDSFDNSASGSTVISTENDLTSIASAVNSGYTDYSDVTFTLANDIVLTSAVSIGTANNPFNGTLDGTKSEDTDEDGNTVVEGYTITLASSQTSGLFAYLGEDAVISNLGITALGNTFTGTAYTATSLYAGALADVNYGTVSNVSGDVTLSGSAFIGGLVGHNLGLIEGCSVKAVINSGANSMNGYTGGIAAVNMSAYDSNYEAFIKNCTLLSGSCIQGNSFLGGIAGANLPTQPGDIAITNVGIEDCTTEDGTSVSGTYNIGGIVGRSRASISGCVNYATVTGNYNTTQSGGDYGCYVGGIVGCAHEPSCDVSDCVNYGSITGNYGLVGGIAGDFKDTSAATTMSITRCINYGEVTGGTAGSANGGDMRVGGIAGRAGSRAIVTECVNMGTVTGTTYVGGIVGLQHDANYNNQGEYIGTYPFYVSNCYSQGSVIGITGYIGGIAGSADYLSNSYWYGEYTGIAVNSNSSNVGVVAGTATVMLNCYLGFKESKSETGIYVTEDSNATELTTAQFASGEAAYLLDGGTGTHNNVWTQDKENGYPVLGTPSYYYISGVQEDGVENGTISIEAGYYAVGDEISITATPDEYENASTGAQYEYVLNSVTIGDVTIDVVDGVITIPTEGFTGGELTAAFELSQTGTIYPSSNDDGDTSTSNTTDTTDATDDSSSGTTTEAGNGGGTGTGTGTGTGSGNGTGTSGGGADSGQSAGQNSVPDDTSTATSTTTTTQYVAEDTPEADAEEDASPEEPDNADEEEPPEDTDEPDEEEPPEEPEDIEEDTETEESENEITKYLIVIAIIAFLLLCAYAVILLVKRRSKNKETINK